MTQQDNLFLLLDVPLWKQKMSAEWCVGRGTAQLLQSRQALEDRVQS